MLQPSRLLVLVAACAFSPFAVLCQSGFSIAGTIVERGSNRPLNRVMVSISPVEKRELQLSCVTAADGRFAFTNVAAGKFSLTAEKRGETPEGFNQDENYSTAIAVGPGLDSQNIVFPLDVPGSISGTVLDDQGDPVPQAQVWLFRKRVFSGKSETFVRGTANTDSSGAFYLGHLTPGTYFVAVHGHPWYAQNFFIAGSINGSVQDPNFSQSAGAEAEQNQASELDVTYPLTYYGDASDPASASPITVSEGGSATVQITVRPVAAVRVDLLDDDVRTNRGGGPQIFEAGLGGFLIPMNGQVYNSGNHLGLTGIAPGRYVVMMQSSNEGRPEPTVTKTLDLTGHSTLDLRDLPKTSLSGQVSFENSQRPNGEALILLSSSRQSYIGQNLNFPVASDGSLDTKNAGVMPGHYEVQIVNAPGFYIKSLNVKGGKSSGTEIDVAEGAAVHLSILVAKGLSRIDGTAIKEGSPTAGAMVLLVPQDLTRTGQFRRDQSDSDGTFSLPDVEPGRYTLIAIDKGRELEYQNPAVINQYLSQGETLEAPLRDRSAVKVNIQTRR